jgi:UDP-glucose 4-epimerase
VLLAAKKACERKQLKRIVYAASSSAYGDTPTLPKREDMQPNPISPYAVAKLAGELYMQSFWRSYGMETVSLRYFNVFGPRQDPSSQYSGVIAKFLLAMLRNQQPTIYGDGTQSRDFTYIDNVISANFLACTASAEQVAGRTFNIACGERIDLKQLFEVLKKITGYGGEVGFGPPRAGDILHSLADINQAQKQLGYKTLVGFEDGLRRTVEWYQQEAQRSSAAHSQQ